MALYSIIQYLSVTLLYSVNTLLFLACTLNIIGVATDMDKMGFEVLELDVCIFYV